MKDKNNISAKYSKKGGVLASQNIARNNAVNGTKHIELVYPNKTSIPSIMENTPSVNLKNNSQYGDDIKDGWINKLILGDNIEVLKSFCDDPSIRGKITLVYIDPPFATGRIFDQNDDTTRYNEMIYSDTLVGSDYLEFLRTRLFLLRELLAGHGSIYVHLDQKAAFYVKIIMDKVNISSSSSSYN